VGAGKAVPLLKLFLDRAFDLLHSFSVIVSRPLNSALSIYKMAERSDLIISG
jgi:hypothetical protein